MRQGQDSNSVRHSKILRVLVNALVVMLGAYTFVAVSNEGVNFIGLFVRGLTAFGWTGNLPNR